MDLTILVPVGSIAAILFALYLAFTILKQDEGTKEMQKISLAIRKGSKAFLKRQYTTIAIFFAIIVTILSLLAFVFPLNSAEKFLTPFVPFAFLTGGFFSALCGYIGMIVATKANSRTTQGAKQSLSKGLTIAFSSGAVMGLTVVGLALLDLALWFYFLRWYYGSVIGLPLDETIGHITSAMITFGLGASSVALFARVGGGIYTKAADVGADLVGKVEAGIPEDDPRNPAVIADFVGDNVGDIAGMGADLYESYAGSIIATMALAAVAFGKFGLSLQGVLVPMLIATVGVLCSIVGILLVRTKDETGYGVLLKALRKGTLSSAVLISILAFFVVYFSLGMEYIGVYYAVLAGLIAGVVIGFNTEYFTSSDYKPAQSISKSSTTGPATVIISGLSTGMMSTLIPGITVACATIASYYLAGGGANPSLGVYGIGVSAVGMLSTLGVTLASDSYGPVADNAGGIAEFTHQKPEVRERTDALDALGNTTAATGKGFAIGSAALTALTLIAAYKAKVELIGGETLQLSLLDPRILAGLIIGGTLPFIFCALTMRSVGRTAEKIVKEARRQFKQIMGKNAKPDYAKCVDITAKAAQKEMILPALLAIIVPIAIGLLLGIEAVVGLLIGALVCGFALAVFMANAGGAWDNAKKYIEGGKYGGKGSDSHKASVIGDTVGDPCKDTAGPSLNILIKLMSMVSIVFASFVVANSLIW